MEPGLPLVVRVAIFAVLGLVVGSFLTVVIHRVPRNESIVRPRSRCPRCGAELRARDNLPVVGWLLLRGRCRACGERISPFYPLTELATGALFAGAAFLDPLYAAAVASAFMASMVAVAVIDARHRIVPNRITYTMTPTFAAAIIVGDLAGHGLSILDGLLGMVLYAVPLFLIALALPGGMGMGDVKLVAMIGLVLGAFGLRYVGVAAFLGIVGGGVGALLAMAVMGYGRKQQIPFGPFLAAGGALALLLGPPIADWYLGLLP
ncbi:MAG TPA: prepilin peptidase [Actinomycetota bacterium]